ncbi:unnamed protein product [Orchesella dallaii]|uniref:Beta/gamma crystallin 'Greek key' domain-containing protein n=1 Tax=Orchesella dallaii TaxID=48710 RepID=A0ABP1R0P0_9HEXA
MASISFKFIFCLAFLVSASVADTILFFDHPEFQGHSYPVTITGRGCYNFPGEWNDRVSSVNTQGGCIVAWEKGSCSGRSSRIAPGTPAHNNLAAVDFSNIISSFKLC